VLDVARAYEAAGPATLRAVVGFLQEEAQAGREEGDSPVGEQAGAQVEVLTVHKAKGLEYPIVIVADLLSDQPPHPQVVVRHATGEAWLKIGTFEPQGWDQAKVDERRQQDAEERRLLYVALTRARDHLVIPCFPDKRRPAWLDDAIKGFALDGRDPSFGAPNVSWFDTRDLPQGEEAAARTRTTAVIDGTEQDAKQAQAQEHAWESVRKATRKAARQNARCQEAPTVQAESLMAHAAERLETTRDPRCRADRRGQSLWHRTVSLPAWRSTLAGLFESWVRHGAGLEHCSVQDRAGGGLLCRVRQTRPVAKDHVGSGR
jgi:ATP-dependent exoDNAse (exonuclease V) beta subunit